MCYSLGMAGRVRLNKLHLLYHEINELAIALLKTEILDVYVAHDEQRHGQGNESTKFDRSNRRPNG